MKKQTLVNFYNSVTATHDYIIGFADTKLHGVYFVTKHITNVDEITRLNENKLRIQLDRKELHKLVITGKAVKLMSLDKWNELYTIFNGKTHLNRGYMFEREVAKYHGIEWNYKTNQPAFYEEPDMIIDGIGYQLKFGPDATFTSETTMNNYYAKH